MICLQCLRCLRCPFELTTQNLLITKHISEEPAPMEKDENPVFEPCASAQERIVSGTGNGIGRNDAAQFAAFPHAEISADGERESRFKDVERRPKMSVVPETGHWEVVR